MCYFALTIWKIVALSRHVSFEDIEAKKLNSSVDVEIDLCYYLNLEKDTCILLNGTKKDKEKSDGLNCKDFENPIACYTKDF